jgi:hypothetical protein
MEQDVYKLTQEEFTEYLKNIGYIPTFEKAQAAFEHSRLQGKNQPITHPLD